MLKPLQALIGKKLLWAGYDNDTEFFTLVFEGNQIIQIAEYTTVPNADNFFTSFLGAKLDDAKNVVDLDKLVALKSSTEGVLNGQEAPQAATLAAPEGQPSPAPAEVTPGA